MDLSQIKGHKNLVRDLETGAILNTSEDGAVARKRIRELKQKEKLQLERNTDDINSMKQEIDHLKNDVGEIKGLLTQLLDKIS